MPVLDGNGKESKIIRGRLGFFPFALRAKTLLEPDAFVFKEQP